MQLVRDTFTHPHFPKLKKLRDEMVELVAAQEDDLIAHKASVCAFVTFENDEGKDFTVKFFKNINKLAQKSCGCASFCAKGQEAHQLDEVKFRGEHVLKVHRASEPEDIIYENMECSKTEVALGRR